MVKASYLQNIWFPWKFPSVFTSSSCPATSEHHLVTLLIRQRHYHFLLPRSANTFHIRYVQLLCSKIRLLCRTGQYHPNSSLYRFACIDLRSICSTCLRYCTRSICMVDSLVQLGLDFVILVLTQPLLDTYLLILVMCNPYPLDQCRLKFGLWQRKTAWWPHLSIENVNDVICTLHFAVNTITLSEWKCAANV